MRQQLIITWFLLLLAIGGPTACSDAHISQDAVQTQTQIK